MPDLGLSALTDDQLLELLQEMCQELLQRDPTVRRLAQEAIADEATKRKELLQSYEEARQVILNDFRRQMRLEALEDLRERVRTGEVRVISAPEELTIVCSTTTEARQILQAEMQKAKGLGAFSLNVKGNGLASIQLGSRMITVACAITPDVLFNLFMGALG